MENDYELYRLIMSIFFAFFPCYCKDFEIFFAKNENAKKMTSIVVMIDATVSLIYGQPFGSRKIKQKISDVVGVVLDLEMLKFP